MAFALVTLSACVTNTFATQKELSVEEPRILLLQPNVTLGELSMGGVVSVKAGWTNAARGHIRTTLTEELADLGAHTMVADNFNGDALDDPMEIQLSKLHAALGHSIVIHQLAAARRLPTKETFDWSLGPAVAFYREKYDADYALFVFVEDTYASADRKVASVMAAVLFGVSIQLGRQSAFASMVDLETGEVIWFNRVFRGTGDLREEEPARETVRVLMHGFPTGGETVASGADEIG